MADGYHSSDQDVQENGPPSSDGEPGHFESAENRHWSGILSKFLIIIRSRVPLGYEDETGFHTGIMSPEK